MDWLYESETGVLEKINEKLRLILFYTNLIDALGLHFADPLIRHKIFLEVNKLALEVKKRLSNNAKLYVISDLGMKIEERLGTHSKHGFFSSNTGKLIEKPQELYSLLKKHLVHESPDLLL